MSITDNKIVLLGAPSEDKGFLKGTSTDLKKMEETFLRWYKVQPEIINYATKDQMMTTLANVSSDVTDEYGTLIGYFTGHGYKDNGDWYTQDKQRLTKAELVEAICSKRKGPLGRLILIVDACYSGNWVNGINSLSSTSLHEDVVSDKNKLAQKIINFAEHVFRNDIEQLNLFREGRPLDSGLGLTDAPSFTLFRELGNFSTANKDQMATDLGEEEGGRFSLSFRTALDDMDVATTFAQFAENVVELTDLKSNPKHKPVYRMYPKSLSSELMFQIQYNLPDEESAKHANAIAENLSNKFNCEFDVRMRTSVNSKSGRYLFEVINKFSGRKWQTWWNINTDIEEEVSLILKESITGSSFFSDCERH